MHYIPVAVTKKIERLRRDFLWGKRGTKFQQSKVLHSVAWSKVCRPKNQGGLGITSIRSKNLALLSKWYYKWEKERPRSWNYWVRSEYRFSIQESLGDIQLVKCASDSLKAIKRVEESAVVKDKVSKKNFKWKIRNGKIVLFWEDMWLENMVLKEVFRKLFQLSNHKNKSVAEFLAIWIGEGSVPSESKWSRELRHWEMEEANKLDSIIQNVTLTSGDDELIWDLNQKTFSVSAMVNVLSTQDSNVEWGFIWKIRIPHKVKNLPMESALGNTAYKGLLSL